MTKQLAKLVGMVATVVVIVLGGILIRSAPVTKQKTRMLITMNQNSAGFRYSLRPAERGQEEPGAGGIRQLSF